MVLQSGPANARVWGNSTPHAQVNLFLDGAPAGVAVADSSGRWEAPLPPQPPSFLVRSLRAEDAAGGAPALADLRFGFVLLCGGQSKCVAFSDPTAFNGARTLTSPHTRYTHTHCCFTQRPNSMELPVLALANGTAEAAGAGAFTGHLSLATLQAPRGTVPPWNVSRAGPVWNAVSAGQHGTVAPFSGLCWLTGRALFEALGGGAPVGLIAGSVGGTPIEAWVPEGVLGPVCPADAPPCGGAADSALFNGLIAPFAPFAVGAVLFDQAERDVRCFAPATNRTAQYPCMERALVGTWRDAFKSSGAAFAAIQLPGYLGDCSEHGGDYYNCVPGVFNMRLAQEQGVISVPNASVVVTYDLSCPFGVKTPECPIGSVHNLNKTLVAARAARALLAQVDPAAFPPSGAASPRATSVTAAPTGRGFWLVTVEFDAVPLALRGTQYCVACCSDGVGDFDASAEAGAWVNATGVQQLAGGAVVFTVGLPVKPAVVRYTANQPFPQCAVVGGASGLPALPFLMAVAA